MGLTLALALTLSACGGGGSSYSGGGSGGGGGGLQVGEDAGDLGMSAHALRRVAFGPTQDELDQVVEFGVSSWIESQLHPSSIQENPALQPILNQIPYPNTPYGTTGMKDLVRFQIAHAVFSRRQLREQLVHFWENHFNTDYWTLFRFLQGPAQTRATYLEWKENELFRQNAFGSFHDLLVMSATSPNMIIYLDNVSNTKGNPNENYAREVLELFTMGVDNGYTESDIEEVARCFTGWGVCEVRPRDYGNPNATCNTSAQPVWSFRFKAGQHDTDAKTIFAGTSYELHIPARPQNQGIQDGYDVLAHLASLPHTAEYVSTKLIQRFVSDSAPQALVNECKSTWASTDGDIREVLRTIFESDAFRSNANLRWNKVRTPFESLVATTRALEGFVNRPEELDAIRNLLDGILNQPLFRWSTPDGYPEDATAQTGTGKLLGGLIFKRFIYDSPNAGLRFDLRSALTRHGVPLGNVDAIVDFYGQLLFQGNLRAAERNLMRDFLMTDESGNPAPLDPAAADYDERLHLFAVFLCSFPQVIQQ